MSEALERNWCTLLQCWGVSSAQAAASFVEVSAQYQGPTRFYHTLQHIQNMLAYIESLQAHTQNLPALQLATWLHDVIYDSQAADNEERSADYAQSLCTRLALPVGKQVAELILTTKSHQAEDNPDAKILLDADLAILGASEAEYRTYAEQIRQEYAWVPERDYCQGRQQVLKKFLAKPRIYHYLGQLEAPARVNLESEIGRLSLNMQR